MNPPQGLLSAARPDELGNAFFYHDGQVIDCAPYRNHRDWLLAHVKAVGLPDYIIKKPSKALFESYKLGWLRLVWDEGGLWTKGRAAQQGKVLYINGLERDIWTHMRDVTNDVRWAGNIDVVVIEYLDIVQGKPKWDRYDIFKVSYFGHERFDDLYKGRRPRRSLAPPGAIYGGDDYRGIKANRQRNLENDQ